MSHQPALRWSGEDRAVSPVVGAVLLVAIAVLLSATVGTLALSLGEEREPVPETAWSYEYDGDPTGDKFDGAHILIRYEQGPPLPLDQLTVKVKNSDSDDPDEVQLTNPDISPSETLDASDSDWDHDKPEARYEGDTLRAGDFVIIGYRIGPSIDSVDPANEVRIAWTNENGDRSHLISGYDIRDGTQVVEPTT